MKIDNNFRSQLLKALEDPKTAKQLETLLGKPEKEPTTFAPFYRNKVGKITKGHLNLERHKRDLELTPIYEEEAVELGLMTQAEAKKAVTETPVQEEPQVDLNNVSDEELADLRQKARALGVPNWQVKKAARLRGDIKKIELKAQSQANEPESSGDSVTEDAAMTDDADSLG